MISILKVLAVDSAKTNAQTQLTDLSKNSGLSTDLLGQAGILTVIINSAIGLVGIVATIMLIIGGFRYATSAGNEKAVTAAKQQIMYAIIGLIIVLIAFAITNFVLNQVATPTKTN